MDKYKYVLDTFKKVREELSKKRTELKIKVEEAKDFDSRVEAFDEYDICVGKTMMLEEVICFMERNDDNNADSSNVS